MNRMRALQKVLELAGQNALTVNEVAENPDLEDEAEWQAEAMRMMEGVVETLEVGCEIAQLGAPRFWLEEPRGG